MLCDISLELLNVLVVDFCNFVCAKMTNLWFAFIVAAEFAVAAVAVKCLHHL